MAYVVFKDLPRRIASDKVLPDKAFNIIKNPKYYGYQNGLPSIVYSFLDKKSSGSAVKTEIMSYQESAEELRKPIIRKFDKRKVHSSFMDNVWGADLADMQLISKSNKGIHFVIICY